MALRKSLEYSEVFIALLCDVQTLHSDVLSTSDLTRTINKVRSRISQEGLGFLTKTLPRLGKAFDRALAGQGPLRSTDYGFKPAVGVEYPRFLGELFGRVLDKSGYPLLDANVACVESLRQIFGLLYKLEMPYDAELERNVIAKFERTDDECKTYNEAFEANHLDLLRRSNLDYPGCVQHLQDEDALQSLDRRVVRRARRSLYKLFALFDHSDIFPRHGPGAVSTKERLWDKYVFRNISKRITDVYPFDAYYMASVGHVCDSWKSISDVQECENSAKVVLVPKDSRGPRLISCEPLEFQWIQQGLARAVVRHVEQHPLTRDSVRFTDQAPNQFGALLGSMTGKYATLDLNEASDRVSLGLVRLLFPEPLLTALLACRSLSTTLPDGSERVLHKFAPMGSALCFPILALTIWSLATAVLEVTDADDGENLIYVYGDDVIVRTAQAEHVINILERFGLKVNRDKSCTSGLFRESCGTDAYRGERVTPVRIRTLWSHHSCPESYSSWISYANSLWERKYYHCYDYIVGRILDLYGPVPPKAWNLSTPSLHEVPEQYIQRIPRRVNPALQKLEYKTLGIRTVSVKHATDGWTALLRYFSERCSTYETYRDRASDRPVHARYTPLDETSSLDPEGSKFSVSEYTKRGAIKLETRWR